MIIANPIYDVVFKRLMEDARAAKFFIQTLLEEEVESVQVMPQEYTTGDLETTLTIYRLDYVATIKTGPGTFKKVRIEIQKARNTVDIMRFRNYLAREYSRKETVVINNVPHTVPLPIVTIYLLGFNLPEIESPAIKINRQYLDLLTHGLIHKRSDFAENLTHDCYIVQLPRIGGKTGTKLEKLLSVFEQRYFADEYGLIKQYNYNIDNEDIRNIVDIVHYIGTDPGSKKKIEDEREFIRTMQAMRSEKEQKLEREAVEKNKIILEQEKTIREQGKTIQEQGAAIEQQGIAVEQQNTVIKEQGNAMATIFKELEELKKRMGQ